MVVFVKFYFWFCGFRMLSVLGFLRFVLFRYRKIYGYRNFCYEGRRIFRFLGIGGVAFYAGLREEVLGLVGGRREGRVRIFFVVFVGKE